MAGFITRLLAILLLQHTLVLRARLNHSLHQHHVLYALLQTTLELIVRASDALSDLLLVPYGHPHRIDGTLINGPVIPGKAFSRVVQIWLENTDFTVAASSPTFQKLAKQAITLTSYLALTQ